MGAVCIATSDKVPASAIRTSKLYRHDFEKYSSFCLYGSGVWSLHMLQVEHWGISQHGFLKATTDNRAQIPPRAWYQNAMQFMPHRH